MDNKEFTGIIGKIELEDNISRDRVKIIYKYIEDRKILPACYNNGVFDDYILMNILTMYTRELEDTLIDNNERVLQFKYKNMKSKYMYQSMFMSLKKATTGFKCDITKGYLDHNIVQSDIYNGTFETYMNENRTMIEDCAKRDVISLKELYFKAKSIFKSINTNLMMIML